jgi:predicted AlkP superfamily phosphohydrolase/phosphomutase
MAVEPGEPTSESLFSNVNWTRTKAYAIGLNGIYLNLVGREKLGIVRKDQVAELKRQLIEDLSRFTDPESSNPVISKVWAAEEIYQGQETDNAPDVVVGYAEGYRASWQTALGGMPARLVQDNDRNWSGDHCVDPAFVPGVLFTSFPLDEDVRSIQDLPALIASGF